MLDRPARFATLIPTLAAAFVEQRSWRYTYSPLLGVLLSPGQRTVCR